MKWIELLGNFTKINGNTLTYTPAHDLSNFSHEKGKNAKFTSRVQSSAFFENGVISFKLNIGNSKDAFFALTLSNKKLVISLNSNVSNKPFLIREVASGDPVGTIFDKNGDKEALLLNHDYDFRIEVSGSFIKLFIDDVLVCNASYTVSHSQVSISMRSREVIVVKDFNIETKRPKVFVVMQFSEEYNQLYNQVIKPVCESFGYECLRGDEYFTTGSILKDIIDAINESAIVIADITPNNPNVFYEVGYSHALNKPTILLSDKKRDKLPFDVSGFRTLFYDNTIAGKSEVENRLKKHLENIQTGN